MRVLPDSFDGKFSIEETPKVPPQRFLTKTALKKIRSILKAELKRQGFKDDIIGFEECVKFKDNDPTEDIYNYFSMESQLYRTAEITHHQFKPIKDIPPDYDMMKLGIFDGIIYPPNNKGEIDWGFMVSAYRVTNEGVQEYICEIVGKAKGSKILKSRVYTKPHKINRKG